MKFLMAPRNYTYSYVMKKIMMLFGIAASMAVFTSCNDEPWEDYKWATTDDGFLYSTNKCMSEKEFKNKVVGHVWDGYSFWRTNNPKDFGQQQFLADYVGKFEGGYYFTETECTSFRRIQPWELECTTAKWVYVVYPIERVPEKGIIRFNESALLGLHNGDLELIRTTTDGEKPLYYFELWGRKNGYDIDEVMANAITHEELDRLYKEWLEQHPNHAQ